MTRATVLLSLSFVLVGCSASRPEDVPEGRELAARIYRPGCAGSAYPTIQSAIDAAADFDILRVCAGTYTERLVVDGKALRFVTESGLPDVTIDAQTFGAGLTVSGGADVSVDRFAFVNGSTADGGGNVSCVSSELDLSNGALLDGFSGKGGGLGATDCTGLVRGNAFEGNSAWRGGGAWIVRGGMTIEANTFLHNEADGSSGGALYVEGTSDVVDNTFDENRATLNGGAALVSESLGTISGNTVSHSSSDDDGGGIYVQFGGPMVEDNVFTENASGDEAGGLRIKESFATVRNNVFTANTALDRGGAMKVSHDGIELSGNTFVDNTAPDGGAIYLFESGSTLTGNTFEGNVATGSGGALYVEAGWDPVLIEDSTFDGNEAGTNGGHVYIALGGLRATLRRVELRDGLATRGGGLFAVDTDLVIENTVFGRNEATAVGGALFLDAVTGTLANAVAWQNTAPQGSGLGFVRGRGLDVVNTVFSSNTVGAAVSLAGGTAPTVRYTDFFGNPSNFAGMADLTALNGNAVANPRFTGPATGDFTLRANSTLRDAGDPAILDPDGTRSDMGVYGGPGSF